jgi:4-diphosphocytidyl-2-C-methyl-D-erythritol kinase
MTLSLLAPAKINLSFRITGKRDDGYHELDSLVVFADVGDKILIEPATVFSFKIDGDFAGIFTPAERDSSSDSSNIAVRAVWALSQAVKREPSFRLTLTKNLPAGAGLGGGSADAAAVLWGLAQHWGIKNPLSMLEALALPLGADVPVCLGCRPVRMRGIGEILTPVPMEQELPAVLVWSGVSCPTPAVFRHFSGRFSPPESLPDTLDDVNSLIAFLSRHDNDLTEAAKIIVPEIATTLEALKNTASCRLARMSGSGSACFGLYDDRLTAQNAAQIIKHAHPTWWVQTTMLNRPTRY